MDHRISDVELRSRKDKDLANYYRVDLADVDAKVISSHLLQAIDKETISPAFFKVFLTARADDATLVEALRCDGSILVRSAAIKEFGRRMSASDFSSTWTAVNGARGLVELMTKFSVYHVRHLCGILGRCSTSTNNRESRQQCLTELLMALTSDIISDVKNPEKRQLQDIYLQILPSCTPAFLAQWQNQDGHLLDSNNRLFRAHPVISYDLCIKNLATSKVLDQNMLDRLMNVFLNKPTSSPPSGRSDLPLGLTLNIDALQDVCLAVEVISPPSLLEDIVRPLVRRIFKKVVDIKARTSILRTVIQVFESHPQCCTSLKVRKNNTLFYFLRLWSRMPAIYVDILIQLLSLMPGRSQRDNFEDVEQALAFVSHKNRLPLLRLMMRNLKSFNLDIDEKEGLERIADPWPGEIFLFLPQKDANKLLNRLAEIKPADEFLLFRNSRCRTSSILSSNHSSDPTVYHIWLSRDVEEALEKTKSKIDAAKKDVSQTSDREARSLLAEKPICFAIASGSCEVYADTLIWARRFNKDPLTRKRLYSRSSIASDESIILLSGVPESLDGVVVLTDINAAVRKGNETILLLLETACMALREPGFRENDWNSVFDVFGLVVWERARRTHRFVIKDSFTDEDLWEHVWKDTLGMLLTAEKIGLNPENFALKFNKLAGPIGTRKTDKEIFDNITIPRVILRFFDELAKARDELFQEYRREIHPEVITLPAPWPRGLPLKSCLPMILESTGYQKEMPYLFSRAYAILFVDPAVAMANIPDDDRVLAAIGPYLDGYAAALRFYQNSFSGVGERANAMREVWEYATLNLAPVGLSEEASGEFWRDICGLSLAQVPKSFANRTLALPSTSERIIQPIEWDPDPDYKSRRTSHQLNCLDCMLHNFSGGSPSNRSVEDGFRPYGAEPFSPFTFSTPPWLRYRQQETPPIAADAAIVATLLFMNNRAALDRRILTNPFPSATDLRYPALFLADDFLERTDLPNNFAKDILRKYREVVPPSLVLDLIHILFTAYNSTDASKVVNVRRESLFSLIKELVKSDKPHISLKIVQRVILERSEDSAWHRQVLSKSLMERLTAKDAAEFLSQFSGSIRKKLQHAAPNTESNERNTGESVVKVTTVKMLAQLLSRPLFIDPVVVVDLLMDLFTEAKHLDIRIAILESLGSILNSTQDSGIRDRILTELERSVVPLAATMHDRHMYTEADWEQAEIDLSLPEIQTSELFTRGFEALLDIMDEAKGEELSEIVDRLIIPAVRLSAKNNDRWTRLLLRRLDLPASIDLPKIPVKPYVLERVLQNEDMMPPSEILKMWADAATMYMAPSAKLIDVKHRILNSPSLRSADGSEHFLGIWHMQEPSDVWSYATTLFNLLYRVRDRFRAEKAVYEEIAAIFLKLAFALIEQREANTKTQSYYLHLFEPPFDDLKTGGWTDDDDDDNVMLSKPTVDLPISEQWNRWRRNIRPLLKQVLDRIEGHRTAKWQADSDRIPSTLYDTYLLRLWLLPWPCPSPHDYRGVEFAGSESSVQDFARSILAELESLVRDSQRPYHHRFTQLKEIAKKISRRDFCDLACGIGQAPIDKIEETYRPLLELIRIEIVIELLLEADTSDPVFDVSSAREMLETWSNSTIEEIRTQARRALGKLFKEKK